MQADEDETAWLTPAAQLPGELEKCFSELESMLSMWAERGTRRMSEGESTRLRAIAHRLTAI
jgi:hypothetical protein